jgi:hypothetical protein
MKNPFIYGEEVSGKAFCDRRDEIKELLRDIENGQNVIIFSPRRYGKTSLIKEVLRKAKAKGILTFYVDLYPAITKEKFIEVYAKGISRSLTGTKENILRKIRNLLPRLVPKIVIKGEGLPDFEFDFDRRNVEPLLDDLLNVVKNRVDMEKKSAVLVFDEFQEITNYRDDEIERKMRSSFQSHHNVSYIFMGSKRHLMNNLFNNPNRPFYKSGKHFPLQKIDRREFIKFIKEKFDMGKYQIENESLESILDITKCHPYYTQMLSHILWEQEEDIKKISKHTVETAINKLLNRESGGYLSTWETLTQKQKQLLEALAKSNSKKIFSGNFISKYNLVSTSSVQKAIKVLVNKELVERENGTYEFTDVFFRLWIEKRL